jgi:hypothetical protein
MMSGGLEWKIAHAFFTYLSVGGRWSALFHSATAPLTGDELWEAVETVESTFKVLHRCLLLADVTVAESHRVFKLHG